MSLDDIKHAMPNSLSGKMLTAALTIGVSTCGGWIINTTFTDHSSIAVLTEDVHNLVGVVKDSKSDTDSEIGRLVNIQERQEGELARIEQAMRDRMKTEVGP